MIKAIFKFAACPLNYASHHPVAFTYGRGIFKTLNIYGFSKEETAANVESQFNPQIEGEDRASSFYRNSIRRININDKGKGKFTEHHLLRLIKLIENVDQQPLLFEAYYNYLGHFTVISSTSVDKMLLKSLSFEGCSIDKAIEIFENHNYLGYFPHYSVTSKLIELTKANLEHYHVLLNVFIQSPLIKFNDQILQSLLTTLADINTPNTTASLIVKLLTQRQHYRLFEDIITRRQLLSKITQALESRFDNQVFKVFRRSEVVKHWCSQILSSEPLDDDLHYQIAILSMSSKLETVFGDNLILIKDQQKVIRCLLYLEGCPESFQKAAVKYINGLEVSEDLKVRLEQFKTVTSDPITVETE